MVHPDRRVAGDPAAAAVRPPPPPPAMVAQMKATYDQAIESLEKELARSKNDSDRKELAAAIDAMKKQRSEALGEAPVVDAPAAPIKLPPKSGESLTLEGALADLKKVLADNAPPQALAAFAASEDHKSAARSAKASAAALLQKRPMAALAALLRARELAPKDPLHLVNLAGLCNKMQLPRHALALLDAAEAMKTPFDPGFGMDGRAVILANRGHALIAVGRFADAETALRAAMDIDPMMGEARANLALALWNQNDPMKKEEAVLFARVARKRSMITKPSEAQSPAPPTPQKREIKGAMTLSQLQSIAAEHSRGRPPASSLFDLSGGKQGSLPTIKIPRTIVDGAEMHPKVEALTADLNAKIEKLTKRGHEVDEKIRARERAGGISPIVAQRCRDIMHYIGHPEYDPTMMSLYLDQRNASFDPGVGSFGGQTGNPWGSIELSKEHDAIWAARLGSKAMHDATEPYHGRWLAPIHNYETSINRWFRARYAFQTALAAKIGDPLYHEAAVVLIEQQAHLTASHFVGTLDFVTRYDRLFVSLFGTNGRKGQAEDHKPGDLPQADSCHAAMRGEYTAAVSVGFVEVSGNCDKIAVELSVGEWVKAFGEVEYTMESGEISIFLGGAGEVGLPGTVVKSGAKAGCFLTLNSKGEFVDAGFKTARTSGVEIDVIVGSVGYERAIETPYSIVAAFTP